MKVPIPSDWNGEDWRCIQLQIPDSIGWSIIVTGMLTSIAKGRFWDEKTGVIKDVQAIANEIFNRSFPFVPCGETEPTTETINEAIAVYGGAPCIDWGLEDMPCIDLTNLIRWGSNGQLQVRNSCCEWEDVTGEMFGGGISGGGGSTGTWGEPDGFDPDNTDISTCAMATALADALHELGDYIWTNCDNGIAGILVVVNAQNHMGLDLSTLWTIALIQQALIMKGVIVAAGGAMQIERHDVFGDGWEQEVTCALLPFMGADGSADPDELYNAFKTWVNQKYPIGADAENVFIANFWTDVALAIGKGSMRDVAVSAATLTADCECFGIGNTPDVIDGDSDWYLGNKKQVVIMGTGGFTFGEGSIFDTPEHDVYGCAFSFEYLSGDPINRLKRSNACSLSPDFCMTVSNSDSFDTEHTYIQAGPIAYDALDNVVPNASQANLSGKTSDVIGSPLTSPLDTIEQKFAVQATGNEGEVFVYVRVTLRWLHNYGSPSHGA